MCRVTQYTSHFRVLYQLQDHRCVTSTVAHTCGCTIPWDTVRGVFRSSSLSDEVPADAAEEEIVRRGIFRWYIVTGPELSLSERGQH